MIPHAAAPRGTCRWCGLLIVRPDGRSDRRRNWHPECVETYKLCWPGHARQRVKERFNLYKDRLMRKETTNGAGGDGGVATTGQADYLH